MVALFVTSILITKFKQVRFLVIYPAIATIMLVLVYLIKTPAICYIGAFVIGYAAAGGVLQMATATVNELFPKIKGTITSLVMIASSLCNYTILSAAANMSATGVLVMNIVITVIGVLLAPSILEQAQSVHVSRRRQPGAFFAGNDFRETL